MLVMLPVSFAAFAGLHTFGYAMRENRIRCRTPRNERVAFAVRAVFCIGLPGKFELIAAGAPMTLAALGSHTLHADRRKRGTSAWRRPSVLTAISGGATLIATGTAAVVVSLVAEGPVLRERDGWGWPFQTQLLVAQSGAALMAVGGALVCAGAAHIPRRQVARRGTLSARPVWTRGPGFVAFGRF